MWIALRGATKKQETCKMVCTAHVCLDCYWIKWQELCSNYLNQKRKTKEICCLVNESSEDQSKFSRQWLPPWAQCICFSSLSLGSDSPLPGWLQSQVNYLLKTTTVISVYAAYWSNSMERKCQLPIEQKKATTTKFIIPRNIYFLSMWGLTAGKYFFGLRQQSCFICIHSHCRWKGNVCPRKLFSSQKQRYKWTSPSAQAILSPGLHHAYNYFTGQSKPWGQVQS